MSKTRVSKPGKKDKSVSRTPSISIPSSQVSMKTAEIRDLIDFIAKSGLNEVNIETKELKLSVKREPDQKLFKSNTPVTHTAPIPPVATLAPSASTAQLTATKSEAAQTNKTVEIKSPMIGTFYRSADPDSAVFASVGDKITKGQTVCIIEAMKLFNEIEAEISGTLVKICVENATPVEYDQALFIVEPD